MKTLLATCFSVVFFINVSAQKTETEYKEYYQQFDWSASDLVNALDTLIKYTNGIKQIAGTAMSFVPEKVEYLFEPEQLQLDQENLN